MFKVKAFVGSAPVAQTRAPAYLVNPAAKNKIQPFWPIGNPALPKGVSEIPVTARYTGQSHSDQIRGAFTNYYRYIGKIPARRSFDRQVKHMCVNYEDLQKLGFEIQDVTTFGLRHATALLAKWQAAQCAPNTVYVRWSGLRTWSRVLGKDGMLAKLQDLQPGFDRRPLPGGINRVLDCYQLAHRSNFLKSKPDWTVYLVDRLCRDLDITREEALQVELHAVNAVVDGGAAVLRVGKGVDQKNIPLAQHNRQLFIEIRNFMVSCNRKVLAWSDLNLEAALQKYDLRLSYVSRTLFAEEKTAANSTIEEGGAA